MAFKKIEDEGTLPGPRALLISGFSEESHRIMTQFINDKGLLNIKIVPCREDSLDRKISDVLTSESDSPIIPNEKLPPVMLWSGIDHGELDVALGSFQESGLQRPIFATTTEHNLDFTVKELLQHLLSEQKSLRETMKKNQ
jgi:Domain of unknown function (DUF3783)